MDSNQLTMRWIPVTDASGRTHLEAVWIAEAAQAPASTQAA
jgi:hypothetical protein